MKGNRAEGARRVLELGWLVADKTDGVLVL